MSKITIVIPDRVVLIDGMAFEIPADKMPPHDSALHSIQFSDGVAECQYNNERLTGDAAQALIRPFCQAWADAKTARDYAVSEDAARAAATQNAPATGTDPV